jgi:glucosamine--fructose-6-phosphate aminotransferase (isomerizing)
MAYGKLKKGQTSKGDYAHYMQKEIFEQPQAISDTLESRITKNKVLTSALGLRYRLILKLPVNIAIVTPLF